MQPLFLSFFVSEIELNNLRKKLREHAKKIKKCRNINRDYKDPIKGAYLVYKFTQTGIGVRVDVICSCKTEFDISDYDSW